jgi:hypothetical protein
MIHLTSTHFNSIHHNFTVIYNQFTIYSTQLNQSSTQTNLESRILRKAPTSIMTGTTGARSTLKELDERRMSAQKRAVLDQSTATPKRHHLELLYDHYQIAPFSSTWTSAC